MGPLPKVMHPFLVQMIKQFPITAQVHLKSQPSFDMNDPNGDPSYRAIPSHMSRDEFTITHEYYDHSAADRDIIVVFPLDRMQELLAEGRIGGIAPVVYG